MRRFLWPIWGWSWHSFSCSIFTHHPFSFPNIAHHYKLWTLLSTICSSSSTRGKEGAMPLFGCPMFNVWCGHIWTQPYLNATIFERIKILNATMFECEHIWKISDFHFFGTYLRLAPTFFFSRTFLISFFQPQFVYPTPPFFFFSHFFTPLNYRTFVYPFGFPFFIPTFFNPTFSFPFFFLTPFFFC